MQHQADILCSAFKLPIAYLLRNVIRSPKSIKVLGAAVFPSPAVFSYLRFVSVDELTESL